MGQNDHGLRDRTGGANACQADGGPAAGHHSRGIHRAVDTSTACVIQGAHCSVAHNPMMMDSSASCPTSHAASRTASCTAGRTASCTACSITKGGAYSFTIVRTLFGCDPVHTIGVSAGWYLEGSPYTIIRTLFGSSSNVQVSSAISQNWDPSAIVTLLMLVARDVQLSLPKFGISL